MINKTLQVHFSRLTAENISDLYPDDDIADLSRLYSKALRFSRIRRFFLGFSIFFGIAVFFFLLLYCLKSSVFFGNLLPAIILAIVFSGMNFFFIGGILTTELLNTPLQHILVTACILLVLGSHASLSLFEYPSSWHFLFCLFITAVFLFLHTVVNYFIFSFYKSLWLSNCEVLDFIKKRHTIVHKKILAMSDLDLFDLVSNRLWSLAYQLQEKVHYPSNCVPEIMATLVCAASQYLPDRLDYINLMLCIGRAPACSNEPSFEDFFDAQDRMLNVYRQYRNHMWMLSDEIGARNHLQLLSDICHTELIADTKKNLLAFREVSWNAAHYCKMIFNLRHS